MRFVRDRQIRLVKALALLVMLCIIDTILIFVRGNLHPGAALFGAGVGLIVAPVALLSYVALAKKDIFVVGDKRNRWFRIVMLFTLVLLGCVSGVGFYFLRRHFPPGYNWSRPFGTSLTFFLLVSCIIGTLGIYFLEKHYGKKFYIAKRKE